MGEKAFEYLDKAEPILRDYNAYPELIELLATRNQVLRAQGHLELADDLVPRSYELSRLTTDVSAKINAIWQIANMEGRKRNFDLSSKWLDEAEKLAQSLSVPNAMSHISYRRGINLLDQGQYAEAEPFLIYSVELNRQLGQRRSLADTLRRLAQVYAETGRLQAARQAAEEALDLFERLGMPKMAAEVQKMLDSLPIMAA